MSERTLDDSQPDLAEHQGQKPRLRLHHLFTLTAVTAILLAISGPRDIRGVEIPNWVQWGFTGLGIVYTLLASLAITIVFYGVTGRKRGNGFLLQPGHWLLVDAAAQQLLIFAMVITTWVISRIQGVTTLDVWSSIPGVGTWLFPGALMLVLNLYIARTKCDEPRWRRVFYAKAAAAILLFLGDLFVLLFLGRAVRTDRIKRSSSATWMDVKGQLSPKRTEFRLDRPRDPAHWCGVGVAFFNSAFIVFIACAVFLWIFVAVFGR